MSFCCKVIRHALASRFSVLASVEEKTRSANIGVAFLLQDTVSEGTGFDAAAFLLDW